METTQRRVITAIWGVAIAFILGTFASAYALIWQGHAKAISNGEEHVTSIVKSQFVEMNRLLLGYDILLYGQVAQGMKTAQRLDGSLDTNRAEKMLGDIRQYSFSIL